MDESTRQSDLTSEVEIRETLQAMKGTMNIIIVTHREALLRIADELYHIQVGQLASHHKSAPEHEA